MLWTETVQPQSELFNAKVECIKKLVIDIIV